MTPIEKKILKKLDDLLELSEKIHLQLISIEQRFTFVEGKLEKMVNQTIDQKLNELHGGAAACSLKIKE